MRKGESGKRALNAQILRFADVQLELPPLLAVPLLAPQVEGADFSHTAFEHDGDEVVGAAITSFERDFERAELFQVLAPVVDERTGQIVLARRGREEPELGGLADGEAELATGDRRTRAFLHSEWDDTQRLERRGETGNRGHRTLDADVIGARGAAADADAAMAGPHAAVICRTPRDGVIEIRRVEDVRRIERSEALLLQPAIQHLDEPPAQRPRRHPSTVGQ